MGSASRRRPPSMPALPPSPRPRRARTPLLAAGVLALTAGTALRDPSAAFADPPTAPPPAAAPAAAPPAANAKADLPLVNGKTISGVVESADANEVVVLTGPEERRRIAWNQLAPGGVFRARAALA